MDQSGDGEDGLWRADNHPYDVIILDLVRPKLDGRALLRKLREGGSTVHDLLLTARHTISALRRKLSEANATPLIHSPPASALPASSDQNRFPYPESTRS